MVLLCFLHQHVGVQVVQDVMLEEVCEEYFHLHVKHMSDDVWSRIGWLTLKKRSCDFWPLEVAGEGRVFP